MDDSKGPAPIIIIRKKGGHGGHHGGAWKVAYADFVTAMMALFIVLWLMSSSDQVKKAVGGYFADPKGVGKLVGSTLAGSGESLSLTKDEMSQIKTKLEEAMKKAPEFQALKEHIQVTVTGEGLRIELLETEKGIFFNSGSAKPSEFGKDLLVRLATEVGKLPNRVLIEGHTDSTPFGTDNGYTNWELSADRANSARRIMQESGLHADQVSSVRGFADQRLRNEKDPKDPSNRRISLIIQYALPLAVTKPDPKRAAGEKKGEPGAKQAEPEAKKPDPVGKKAGPEAKKGEPGAKQAEPAAKKPEPAGKKAEPETKKGEPGAKQAEPAAKKPDPAGKKAEPETKKGK